MPQANYELRIYNPAGALQYIVTDLDGPLQYTKQVNGAGMIRWAVDGSHPTVGNLERDWQVEVWRSRAADDGEENGIAKHVDAFGLVRDEERSSRADGRSTVAFTALGALHLLGRALVAYPAETTDRSRFVNKRAETIAKGLVTYNATTAGTEADGRDLDVPTWGSYVSVAADGAAGPLLDFFCSRRNLLTSLQDLSRIGAGDFDLVKTGARAWEFRWYDGQLGTDRTSTVTFSLQWGNMINPVLRRNWLGEATVAVVAGQGLGEERLYVVRQGANYDASVNASEVLVDARDVTTEAGLNRRGDARLDELRARDELQFDVVQTPGSLYGLHYFLGDLVTARYQGVVTTPQIVQVTVTVDADGSERISVGVD
jgi:hypothetical protein